MAILKDEYTGDVIIEQKFARYDPNIPQEQTPAPKVDEPRTEYIEHQERLDLLQTLLGGTKAMKDAGQKYLPKETKESHDNYQNRLKRSYLFNAFGRTISYLGGQVFAQPVRLRDDVPSAIRTGTTGGYKEDIDLKGNNMDAFLKPVFERGVTDGCTCVLVDFPPLRIEGSISVADEKKAGLRPYWVHIPTSAIIGWKTRFVRGKELFTQVRIREVEEVDDGEFGIKKVNRIRVLEPGSWRLFEEVERDGTVDWYQVGEGRTSLRVIPLAVFRPGKKLSALTAEPPLEDLAYMNLAHWQSTSDQMNILHFTRLPILFGRRLTDPDKLDQIEIGPNRMLHSDDIEGDLKYVEHSGDSISAGHTHLVDLETKMAMWGLQLLMPKTGTITATEKALASGESDSTLKAWALLFKDFIELCLLYTAMYLGKPDGGSIEINTQFRWMQTLDAEVLLRGAQFEVLPKQLVFEELQRRAIVSDQYTFADVQRMFDEENPDPSEFMQGSFGAVVKGQSSPVSTEPDRSPTGTTTPYGFKRGTGRRGR